MEERVKAALEKFEDGYDCSHAVLSSYADLFHFDAKSLEFIKRPCPPLMGQHQELCGAVSGALRALCQKLYEENHEAHTIRESGQPLLEEFKRRFTEKHGSLNCAELLGTDISEIEGQTIAFDRDLFHTHCVKYITDSALLLEEMLGLERKAVS